MRVIEPAELDVVPAVGLTTPAPPVLLGGGFWTGEPPSDLLDEHENAATDSAAMEPSTDKRRNRVAFIRFFMARHLAGGTHTP